MPYDVAVVVLSDRAAAGTRADACIPVVADALGAAYAIVHERVLPDDVAALQAELIDLADRRRMPLVLTSGGTGLSPRDRTPQATSAVQEAWSAARANEGLTVTPGRSVGRAKRI